MPAKRKKRGRGRPRYPYDPVVYPSIARMLAFKQTSKRDIALAFQVSEKTIERWAKQYPEFSRAIKTGLLARRAQVLDDLFMLSSGYDYDEQLMAPTGEVVTVTRRTKKEVGAAIWLSKQILGFRENPGGDETTRGAIAELLEKLKADE